MKISPVSLPAAGHSQEATVRLIQTEACKKERTQTGAICVPTLVYCALCCRGSCLDYSLEFNTYTFWEIKVRPKYSPQPVKGYLKRLRTRPGEGDSLGIGNRNKGPWGSCCACENNHRSVHNSSRLRIRRNKSCCSPPPPLSSLTLVAASEERSEEVIQSWKAPMETETHASSKGYSPAECLAEFVPRNSIDGNQVEAGRVGSVV